MRGVNTSTRRTARFFPVTVTVYYELSRARGGRAGERERDSRGPAALTAVRELVTHVTNNVCALVTRFRTGMFHAHS